MLSDDVFGVPDGLTKEKEGAVGFTADEVFGVADGFAVVGLAMLLDDEG